MSLVRVQFGEFKRSASREADRLVYRLTREKPLAGAPWRGLCALEFVEEAEGSDPNDGQTGVLPPRSRALSERVNSSPRSGGDRNDGPAPLRDRKSVNGDPPNAHLIQSGVLAARADSQQNARALNKGAFAKLFQTISQSSPHRSHGASAHRFARHEFAL